MLTFARPATRLQTYVYRLMVEWARLVTAVEPELEEAQEEA